MEWSDPSILHVTALHGGGVDRHLRDIARSVPRGHLFWHAHDAADVIERPADGRFFALDGERLEAQFAAVAGWLRAQGVGIIHLHSTEAAARRRAQRLAEVLGVRVLATLHDILFLRPDAFAAGLEAGPDAAWLAGVSSSLADAAALIAPSEFVAGLARRYLPGLPVEVIANGSAPQARDGSKLVPRAQFLEARPQHVVAVLGAIGPHKGAELLEALAPLLEGTGIGLVAIGYLERQFTPGWRVPGSLFIHGAYADADAPAWLRAYGAELVLFPGRAPESFSYSLSDAWSAGVPVLAADVGAIGERIRAHGGGWLLPTDFDVRTLAAELERLVVKSPQPRASPGFVPSLDSMARSLEALYARFAVARAPARADPAAIEHLLAVNLDGALFRQELARAAEEYAQVKQALDGERSRTEAFEAQSREWIAKLGRDVEDLQRNLEREVGERRRLGQDIVQLQIHKDAFELLPEFVRKILLKKILDARS